MSNKTDPERIQLLASTPPNERSEVAARYDHQIEANNMSIDKYKQYAKDQLGNYQTKRASAMIQGSEDGRITVDLGHMLARLNRGVLPDHVETTISQIMRELPEPTDDEIEREAHRLYQRDEHYLAARYGVYKQH